jgi:hypothetical protein
VGEVPDVEAEKGGSSHLCSSIWNSTGLFARPGSESSARVVSFLLADYRDIGPEASLGRQAVRR